MLFSLFITLFMATGFQVSAADTIPAPDTTAVHQLYKAVKREYFDDAEPVWRWPHRPILYEAAKLQKGAPDSVVSLRMQFLWQQLASVRASDKDEIPVLFHELFREALKLQRGTLILDAVRWKVDLNPMDMDRHKTIMDELEEVYRNNSSEQHAEWLREYKKILEGGGAKYFFELDFRMRRLAKKYQKIRPPVFGAYAVRQNDKWGWVDENGKTIIPIRYKAVRYNTDRLFEVSDDGKRFIVIGR